MKEFEPFKNLNGIIPCVIIKNYDLFLEKEISRDTRYIPEFLITISPKHKRLGIFTRFTVT